MQSQSVEKNKNPQNNKGHETKPAVQEMHSGFLNFSPSNVFAR